MASPVLFKPLTRVVVTGGSHGNEMSGIYLVKHWLKEPLELRRKTFSATPFLANPRAVEKCRRYIDQDLNRSFKMDVLSTTTNEEDELYEVTRAKEINQLYGPKGSVQACDFMIDMHNTTSNMGGCLIVDSPDNYLAMHIANYVQKNYTLAKTPVYLYKLGDEESYSIDSICKCGLALEVGPQPQGVVRADILARMRDLLSCVLDFINLLNQGTTFPAFEAEAYKLLAREDYPRSADGEITAIVHPSLQDKDFLLLNPGDPIFQTLDGKDIAYGGDTPVYPVFINEGAYYEKKIAFAKTEKLAFSIPAIQGQM
ncbi:N-acyl-aromatic-L-amino acid amidohydrolase (carboxylate-forming) [Rhinatrema bivittatum]|uniref:N-acyl-aromatic-L-amino acid amidohydrolase (carboxylate-forming) n=1 Tax=Rhinatrema bivittatum TaxID=194408 RepID=UPI001126D3CF|nr:N-acyl-aromatic-L-amino acid amidohydrolase (carboxylate-forming) [Rhinatrema bivittatum]XP_029431210.1 N-acyl-aromatic-L-amino acid amidohydrolase (carboxylate-forming) [Rhinatrema bivittatum]XP_029431211.1 N-acyl-aromatic-L-amino acid amidohydrolase (carboxylate-forming) [Rhinatrema bivittatum]